jgi:hypothetical protein
LQVLYIGYGVVALGLVEPLVGRPDEVIGGAGVLVRLRDARRDGHRNRALLEGNVEEVVDIVSQVGGWR